MTHPARLLTSAFVVLALATGGALSLDQGNMFSVRQLSTTGSYLAGREALADLRTSDAARYFREARSEADAWQAARSHFIEEQVARGRHPDTHPDFWNSFAYRGRPPSLSSSPFGHWGTVAQRLAPAGALAAALIVLWVGLRWVRTRRRKKTPPIHVPADARAPSPPSPGRGASPP